MTDHSPRPASDERSVERYDDVIVGAGISGIGVACHLQDELPERRFVLLEALDGFGGTWLTHRYPGIRSDSDLYTFGYRFKPWTGPPIASGAEIRKYLGEVLDENGLERYIRYGHRVERASWSSDENRWTLEATRLDSGETVRVSARFLWMCQGYYRHAEGYTPQWPGMDLFKGRIVHPQTWPEDLEYADQRVVVIGSGATAATLVPAIADACAHVTLVQRSPTYYFARPNSNEVADMLRELDVPEAWVHEIVRRKILHDFKVLTDFALDEPEFARDLLIDEVRQALPPGYDVATHFTPRYEPWHQRIALLPDGDLLKAISAGRVTMKTDEIESFTESGLRLRSGEQVDADIIVTATGFILSVLGDIEFAIDEEPLDLADTVTYRGLMFTGVPNLAWIFGYFRASWTLRVDIVADFVCRLITHMEKTGVSRVVPQLRAQDVDAELLSWIDPGNFNPGYMMRSLDKMPHRLDRPEWRHSQDYWTERETLPLVDLADGCLRFE